MQDPDTLLFMKTHSNCSSLLFLNFLLCSVFLTGCKSKNLKPNDAALVAISSIPSTLDPRFATDSEGMKIGSLIFQSLIKIGPDMNVVGDGAKDWNISITENSKAEKYKLTFNLQENVKFSDGTEASCADWKQSILEYQKEASPFKGAFSNILKVECVEDELSLYLSSYSEKVLNSDLPVIKLMPRKLILEDEARFKKELIGSGPYKVASLKETEITLSLNKKSGIKANIPFLVFKIIKDDFTRFLKMYRGDLDLSISTMPKNKMVALKKLGNLKVINKPGLNMSYLLLNFKNKSFQNLESRQLIYDAIDINEVIKYKLEGLAQIATALITPANPYFIPEFLDYKKPLFTQNELKKRSIKHIDLKQTFVLKTSNTREAVENAKLIAKQLRSIGLKIRHESYEWGTYYKDVKSGDFDMATMSWVGAYDPDIYRIALAGQELPPEGRNRGYYSNPKFDKLVSQGEKELDFNKRKEIYFEVQKLAFEDLAVIPLWYEDNVTVLDQRLKEYEPALNGDYSGLIKAHLAKGLIQLL